MDNLTKYFSFKITTDQETLLKELLGFIDSKKQIFVLKGYAGTGKTSIMYGLVKHLGEIKRPFALLASTGRAAKVLSQKANFPASTLHSQIYALQVREKKNSTNDIKYSLSFSLKMPNVNPKMVYFVDESSMLSNKQQMGGQIAFGSGRLLEDFFTYVGPGKVVFIGDSAQLPPVNSKFSAALNITYLQDTINRDCQGYELSKVMRYKEDSGIFYNTTYFRKIITSGYYPPLAINAHRFDDLQIYFQDNELIKSYYKCIIEKGVDSCVYITLSNKQACFVNTKIRFHLWGAKNQNKLQIDESLMVARNNYLYGLSNGDLVIVDRVENETIKKAELLFRHIHIRVMDPDPTKGFIIKRVLMIDDLLDTVNRDLSLEQDQLLLGDYFRRMREYASEIYDNLLNGRISKSITGYIDSFAREKQIEINISFNDNELPSKRSIIKKITYDNMQSDPFLNALRLKYGYAITCHKAQGSEWSEVFVHIEKSMFYQDKENQYRWMYTALSRAENKIHLLNNRCIY